MTAKECLGNIDRLLDEAIDKSLALKNELDEIASAQFDALTKLENVKKFMTRNGICEEV